MTWDTTMNIDKSQANHMKSSECEPRALEDALGCHYALQVALQTMKERCQQLQLRLAAVEEENLQLRVKKENLPFEMKSDNVMDAKVEIDVEQLQEKVAQLTRQKSQLSHHICMVASENQQLWNRLSRVTQANQSLGSHLTKISDTLSRHDSTGNIKVECQKPKPITKTQLDAALKPPIILDNKEQSLDEISLKLINCLIQEKAELEEQFSQMVDIQTDTSYSIQNLGFAFLDKEDESTVKEVNEHCRKLHDMKKVLLDQHKILQTAVNTLRNTEKESEICRQCQEKSKRQLDAETQNGDEECISTLRQWGAAHTDGVQHQLDRVEPVPEKNASASQIDANLNLLKTEKNISPDLDEMVSKKEDRICPMCGKFYPKLIPFDDFQNHVLYHFTDDDSDPVLNNFEVVS